MENKCTVTHCDLKGFWLSVDSSGNKTINFRVRHRGAYHVQSLTERDVALIFTQNDVRQATDSKTQHTAL